MMSSIIIGTGSYLPSKILTNDDLSKMVETSDEWIQERTGIKCRHIAADDELTSDLALEASLAAIEDAKIQKDDLDAIVLATSTPDRTFPATATILQNKLGIGEHCFAFDVQAVCAGFICAMEVADSLIKSRKAKKVLVVGAETFTRLLDWSDRNTCVLFGDGAGAAILSATDDESTGILATNMHSDGSYGHILNTTGGPSLNQIAGNVHMDGREVFKLAVTKMSQCVVEMLESVNLKPEDIDLLIPHQANKRIIDGVGRKLGLSEEQVILTVAEQANTSAASIPLALDFAKKNNRIKSGDLVVLEAIGGGMIWGSLAIRWQ